MLDLLHPGEAASLCGAGTWHGGGRILANSFGIKYFCSENPLDRPADMRQLHARLGTVQKLWLKQRDKMMGEYRRSLGLPPISRPAPPEGRSSRPAPPDEPSFRPAPPDEEGP